MDHKCCVAGRGALSKWKKVKVLAAQSCPTLRDSMDYRPPDSSVHGILQAGILEWIAILFSRESSWARDRTSGHLHCRQILYHLNHQGRPWYKYVVSNVNWYISAATRYTVSGWLPLVVHPCLFMTLFYKESDYILIPSSLRCFRFYLSISSWCSKPILHS